MHDNLPTDDNTNGSDKSQIIDYGKIQCSTCLCKIFFSFFLWYPILRIYKEWQMKRPVYKKKKKTVYWYTCKKKKSYLLTSLSNFILISWTNHEFIIQFNYLRLSYITRDPILDFVKFLMDSGMIEAPTSSGWFKYLSV